jgi:gluconate 2-dehydrogenase alpha chain
MATKLKEVDVVMVGMGWTGSIISRELTKAGMTVVGLERGADRAPADDFALPGIRDDLRYNVRQELFQDTAVETVTMRHKPGETALPMRRWGAFTPGDGVGGGGSHWNGQNWRFAPSDNILRTHLTQRYGKDAIPEDMTIQDWGVTYDELEPYYDRFEKLTGISGKAGNLKGKIIAGGNPFEGWRANEYPNKPMKQTRAGELFEKASKSLGYHPFPMPSANMSDAYTNSEGLTLGACQYCGHCERFGCEANAKASPNICVMPILRKEGRFELRARAYVSRVVYDKAGKKVTGVIYVDMRTGEEYEQPAGIVILGAYVFGNTQLMLHSGIGEPYDPATGKGVVGKNYCYQVTSGVFSYFEDDYMNPFMGAGALSMAIDDFNNDNFDHSGLGFVGGAYIGSTITNGRPIGNRAVPPGTPRWGGAWKQATAKWYGRSFNINCHGSNYSNRNNYLDLDPTYKDALGRPLVRMTFNFVENDYKMSAYLTEVAHKIAKAMNPTVVGTPAPRRGNFHSVPYQSTHNTGGTIMGTDPKSSVVNHYLQSWDAHNLFVVGASVFPQNSGYNPTGPVGALAYWLSDAIIKNYVKTPGPLVRA